MGQKYTIGEAAELLHISRDALRFYERKGLIMPVKKENGYRYYSGEHISSLLDILFLRKIQCSIQDIQSMYHDGTPQYLHDFLESRIQEEQKLIQMHQQLLRQLMVSRHNSEKMIRNRNQYSVRSIPKTYIFSDIMEDVDEMSETWFQIAGSLPGLEHCYLHQQLIPAADNSYKLQCYLVLEEFAVKKLGLEEEAKQRRFFQFNRCVHTVYESGTISPDETAIFKMQKWAKEQGLELTGEIHSHYLWNYLNSGKIERSCVELYMPVKGECNVCAALGKFP